VGRFFVAADRPSVQDVRAWQNDARIKQRLVEVFRPARMAWRTAVVQQGLELIGRAIDPCQDETWEENVQ
jgi:hypothetical protein